MRFKYFVALDLNFKTCVPRTQITGNFHIFYDKLSTVLKKKSSTHNKFMKPAQ